jgi:hypothetical protein
MIEKHPDVPDHFFVLDRHEQIGDYARTYGDELARRYENYQVLYFPHFPIAFDLPLIRALTIPDVFSKVGVANGIEDPIFKRSGIDLSFNRDHILFKMFQQEALAGYVQAQIKAGNDQIREALRTLFPKYFSLMCGNITWRLTDTPEGDLHIDCFNKGQRLNDHMNSFHRIKLFINSDTEPRLWRTSFSLPEVLARYRDALPGTLPLDRNAIASIMVGLNLLKDAPGHSVAYPPLSAVAVNAEAVFHQVVRGRKVIAAEFLCAGADMLNPKLLTHAQLPGWLAQNGYAAW